MRPSATSSWGLQLLVCEAFSSVYEAKPSHSFQPIAIATTHCCMQMSFFIFEQIKCEKSLIATTQFAVCKCQCALYLCYTHYTHVYYTHILAFAHVDGERKPNVWVRRWGREESDRGGPYSGLCKLAYVKWFSAIKKTSYQTYYETDFLLNIWTWTF